MSTQVYSIRGEFGRDSLWATTPTAAAKNYVAGKSLGADWANQTGVTVEVKATTNSGYINYVEVLVDTDATGAICKVHRTAKITA